ncbi:MAG: hypothetical protein LAN84_16570 [Acidobacteriia bacterium]|nr:hypothetical protein [Terriglobia bacterium]
MKKLFLLAAFLTITATANAQSYTIGASGNLQVLAKAGDTVSVTASLTTRDPDENGEGEALVIRLDQGPFVVDRFFSIQTTQFVAAQDNPVVSASISGFDADETAQVTFAVLKNRFTAEQKKHFSDLGNKYGQLSLGLVTVSGGCALSPEPLITKICALGGLTGGALTGGASLVYQKLASDPFDAEYAVVALPAVPALPALQVQPGVTQGEADAFNAWQANQAQQYAYATAIYVAMNRANSAATMNDAASEQKQLLAAGNYAITLSSLLSQEAALRATWQAAIQEAGFPTQTFSVYYTFYTELLTTYYGLPGAAQQLLTAEGFTPADISYITGVVYVQDPWTVAPLSFPGVLTNAALNTAQATAAQDLIVFAVSVGAGQPLGPGQMVQAEGFLNLAAGNSVTFEAEAHVRKTGVLQGEFTLHDHDSGFSINDGAVQKAVLLGDSGFALTGTFLAADGSAQSFFLLANAASQSVVISTSTGYSASGVLGGGNVKMKIQQEGSEH